jgi:hypothetical protein
MVTPRTIEVSLTSPRSVFRMGARQNGGMNRRSSARLAWLVFGLAGLLFAAGLVFSIVNRSAAQTDFLVLHFFAFSILGAPIASRQPHNAIGWILLAIGIVWGLYWALTGYSIYGLVTNQESLPRPDLSLALSSWLWVPAVGLMGIFLIVLFPDGRLPSPRWRPLTWLSTIAMGILASLSVFEPGSFSNSGFPHVRNPLGIEALRPVMDPLSVIGFALLLSCMLGSAGSLVRRFRRSSGRERIQLKWLVAAAATTAVAYLLLSAVGVLQHFSKTQIPHLWLSVIEQVATSTFVLIPVAVGIAILRYRLYDIDVIINRALVYASLTAVLALIYAVGVAGAGAVVREVMGQASNHFAVAASTLAVAALFRPARTRIQAFIDRRFYRRKYDAAKTVEAFSARLRDEVDLEALTDELLTVVRGTMQPTHGSIWLRR